jgi:aspartyl aminopeptidase
VQSYCNRADLAGGSTLGNISLTHVSIPSADIGLPQLAMHSCFETAGCTDVGYMVDALTAFYSTSLSAENGNYTLL